MNINVYRFVETLLTLFFALFGAFYFLALPVNNCIGTLVCFCTAIAVSLVELAFEIDKQRFASTKQGESK